jgi:multiple sugar transport system permease protein
VVATISHHPLLTAAGLESKLLMRKLQYKHWLVIPAIVTMLAVLIFPLIYSLRTSLYFHVLSRPQHQPFIGLQNFQTVLSDPQLHNAILVTLKFAGAAVTLQLLLGYIIARSLLHIGPLRNVFVSLLMIPMMITPIAVGLIWRMLLHPELGIVNYGLEQLGIGGRPWLGLASTALPTVIFVDVWQWTPFMMILLYAGLLSLPEEPFEAATIDGANFWQKIVYLELPMLRNIIIVALTIRIIDLLRTYDLVYILTGGGPGSTTETISYYIYRLGFVRLNMGQAAAASYLFLLVMIIATTILYTRLMRAEDTT